MRSEDEATRLHTVHNELISSNRYLDGLSHQMKEQLVMCQQELQFCQQDNLIYKANDIKLKKKMDKMKSKMKYLRQQTNDQDELNSSRMDTDIDLGDEVENDNSNS